MPLLLILSCAAFVSALSMRMLDPLVPAIARDFGVTIETTALLASAFTFPYALSQPILGPLGDAIGKARVIKICLGALAVMLLLCALTPQYEYLFAARVVAGIAAGGIIPIAFAIIGDRFDMGERQVALSRLVMASQISVMMGSMAGGFVAAHYSWRWMFVMPAVFTAGVCLLAILSLSARDDAERTPMSFARTRAAYAEAFASPYAAICLIGVFTGGCLMFGLTPFIAGRLERLGMGGLKESGVVIAALSVGGVCFTLLVRRLLKWLGRGRLARTGGTILAVSLVAFALAPEWHLQALAFGCVGFGFFMMHNCLQALGTELAPKSRASGISLMAFVFFLGQACGPVLYTFAFHHFGQYAPIIAAAAVVLAMSWWVSLRLDRMDRVAVPVQPIH